MLAEQLCLALGKVQTSNLCCDSFTLLHRTAGGEEDGVVEMMRIHFALVRNLLESLQSSAGGWAMKGTRNLRRGEAEALSQVLSDILQPLAGDEVWRLNRPSLFGPLLRSCCSVSLPSVPLVQVKATRGLCNRSFSIPHWRALRCVEPGRWLRNSTEPSSRSV